ncbi:dihydroorotase [Methanocalculus sp.]|uniref:dihydroorotase n=1 Tax=Methanocalculus sp. TaxID=2004547 RepID=UPI0027249888|nr:dihydroorotase [Methanocalculus sp.]MDO8841871.1 dihydroorotase [Methanocalculus sp.]
MLDLVLRSTTLPDGRIADLAFQDGALVSVGSAGRAHEDIRCNGLLCIPAATDMHVHMRGGPQSAKEDWRTGTMAALAGGVTMVVDQPNTIPPLLTQEAYTDRIREAKTGALCSFAVNAGVSPGSDPLPLWKAGAMAFGEIFAAPSSYGDALTIEELKVSLQKIHSLGALATIHSEEVGPGSPSDLTAHNRIRSPDGEARALGLIGEILPIGMKPHICHISSTASLRVAPGSKEVTPHHLFLAIEDFAPEDTFARVNPPIRPESDRRALFSSWNSIDLIASDHAPHTRSEKTVSFADAPSGLPGVETMLPLLMNEVVRKTITLNSLVEKTAIAPCRVLGIPPAGYAPGERSDFALYAMQPETIRSDNLHSRAGWTPFEGRMGVFPTLVIHKGRVAYRDGDYSYDSGGWVTGRGYLPGEHI